MNSNVTRIYSLLKLLVTRVCFLNSLFSHSCIFFYSCSIYIPWPVSKVHLVRWKGILNGRGLRTCTQLQLDNWIFAKATVLSKHHPHYTSFQIVYGFLRGNLTVCHFCFRSIAKVIDQIRVFRERRYMYIPDLEFQEAVGQRMQEFGQQDLHTLASLHDTNFHKMTSSRIHGAFKRMRHKLQGKSTEIQF